MKANIIKGLIALVVLGAVVAVSVHFLGKSPPPAAAATTQPTQWWTCGMHPQVHLDHPGLCPICGMPLVPEKAGGSAGSVRIDPTVVQNMGIRTAPVIRGSLTVMVRTAGVLAVPEPAQHDIALKISGYIQKLYANADGMSVAKGEVLFDLYSPDLQVAEQELIGAEQALKTLDGQATPSVRKDAENLVESAKQKLRLWDIAEQDIDAIAASDSPPKTVPFRSPITGHVMDKMIVDGSAVQAGTKVMGIEDHSVLWLDSQVYGEQIPLVKVGQTVSAVVDGAPGKTFTAKITFIYPHLDMMSRTEMARAELDNPNHVISPGMYATVEINTQPVTDAIIAPREAIIDTGTRQIAFVADPAQSGHFQLRDVHIGIIGDNDQVQILDGLSPGDLVVTSGQFLLDVESRTTEAIEKLNGETTPPGSELIHPAGGATQP